MKPEELTPEDSVILKLRTPESSKKIICDKIRKWNGTYVSVMVLETQSYIDYRMVLRVMEAEIIGYEKQQKFLYFEQQKEKIKFDSNEYLSGMKKEQKFIPIITLVLYVGKEKLWDGAKSLYDMLDIREEAKPFVNDFKLNLFDYHDYDNFSQFKTENRLLFEMLSCSNDKEKMIQKLKQHTTDGQVDLESAKAILEILNVKIDLNTIQKEDKNGREVYDMCQAFEDYKEDGRREGFKLGQQQGKIEGERKGRKTGELLALKTVVRNLMKNQSVSFEEAVDMLGISKTKQKKLQSLV